MNQLSVFEKDGILLTDSRDVAEMIGKEHKNLIQSIRSYCEYLGQGNFSQSDFFIQSSYINSQNKEMPCYFLTRKGCDMVANKMTGQKGVLFTAAYVNAFHKMEKHIKGGSKPAISDETKKALAEAKLNNSRARVSSMWMKIAEKVNIPEYQNICASYASKVLAGHEVLPLPEVAEHLYTATEIGQMLGLTANRIGKLANRYGLKTKEYGKTVWDKATNSVKQVECFRYNEKAVNRLREIIETEE